MNNKVLFLGLTNVFVKVIGLFLIIPFYSWILDDGILLFGVAYVPFIFFTDFCSIGIVPGFSLLTSNYVRDKKEEELSFIFAKSKVVLIIVGIIFMLLMLVLMDVISNFYNENISTLNVKIVLFCILPSVVIFPILQLHRGFLLGQMEIKKVAYSIIIEQSFRYLLILISSFLIIKVFKMGINIAIFIAILSSFFGLLISFLYLKKNINGFKTEKKETKYLKLLTKYFLPVGMATIFITFYLAIDLFFARKIGDDTLGLFMFKIPRLIIIPILLSQGIAATIMPNIARNNNKDEINKCIDKTVELVLSISIIFVFIFIILKNNIYSLFYNVDLLGIKILANMSILIFFYSINKVLIGIMQGVNKLKILAVSSIVSYIIKIVINLIFVNIFNYYTFLISSVIAVSSVIFCSLFVLNKEKLYSFKLFFMKTLKVVVYSSISYLFLLVVKMIFDIKNINFFFSLLSTILYSIIFVDFFLILKKVFGK